MIVGHKIELYLTGVQHHLPEPHWQVTSHVIITELHATKGWRRVSHTRDLQRVRNLPPLDIWRGANVTTFKRQHPVTKPRDNFQFRSAESKERSLLRHGWYRRQKQKEARVAATEAWNNA